MKDLPTFLARAMHYAQEHVEDTDGWPMGREYREDRLQCASYQVACFLAHNTVRGYDGVDWSIVIEELVETIPSPIKSVKQWKKILNRRAKELGGWK